MTQPSKVGIIACSGEEIAAGTLSRLATRRVLEALRPRSTVTLCLPLFLAGDAQERRFAQEHPTITVDGCEKLCAKRGTEQYSGRVAVSLVVTDVLGSRVTQCHRSARRADAADEQAVWILSERIAAEVDALLEASPSAGTSSSNGTAGASCGCACGVPTPEAELQIGGKRVAINGLPLVFDHLFRQGLRPGDGCAGQLLATVSIYHEVADDQRAEYQDALADAYEDYCRRRTRAPDAQA